ncbi:hypothetical protein LCGC14_1263410 [marine sediment metagenome]|uniref:Uncharacterized protein n=1 Tax=marine sediment metagenome TaxID=412755 RepID=A0A0F9NGV0_9ZZZZ
MKKTKRIIMNNFKLYTVLSDTIVWMFLDYNDEAETLAQIWVDEHPNEVAKSIYHPCVQELLLKREGVI